MRLTLLFDGDDTLWANNHHFELAIERFVALVAGGAWTEAAIRDELDRVEEAAWHVGGAGTNAFGRNMREAAAGIVAADRLPAILDGVDAIIRGMGTTRGGADARRRVHPGGARQASRAGDRDPRRPGRAVGEDRRLRDRGAVHPHRGGPRQGRGDLPAD